ncbi:MAG: DNA primase [Candidatus Diapherotrites archaeon]|nr:DNA primase [Candidatus Diapherotrites archaeon]
MAKTYLNTVKYEIQAVYEITGVVEKPDIVGALFGQSEGLLGQDMDLKELQQNGKLGRIEITVKKGKGTTSGEITIPSSLDQVKTSILGATIESVDKVGPCEAKIQIKKIIDTRKEKREHITDRAKELLKKMQKFEGVESEELAETIKAGVRKGKIVKLHGLEAGPDVATSKNIIIVEGRADVLKLLSYGINTVVAMNGSNISKELITLCEGKEITVLIDGDRGGDLNIKKLASLTKIDFVARAPDGKEVEELTQKEILQALKRRVEYSTRERSSHQSRDNRSRNDSRERGGYQRPTYQRDNREGGFRPRNNFRSRDDSRPRNNFRGRDDSRPRDNFRGRDDRRSGGSYGERFDPFKNNFRKPTAKTVEVKTLKTEKVSVKTKVPVKKTTTSTPKAIQSLGKDFGKIKGSLKARFLDNKQKKIKDVTVKEMIEALGKSRKKVDTVMFDGIITKRLLDAAEQKGVKNIIGIRKGTAKSDKVKTYTL